MQRSIRHLFEYARFLARLQAEMHNLTAASFPALPERIRWHLDRVEFLSAEQKQPLLRLLESLPDGDRICHGDFHPENLILTQNGPFIIDWESCTQGNPTADVANTILWIRAAFQFDSGLMGWMKRWLGDRF